LDKAIEYLGNAERCEKMALEATSDDVRQTLTDTAFTWRRLAAERAQRVSGEQNRAAPDADKPGPI
jgi:hypothetical protein